jgi:hypothetical protein
MECTKPNSPALEAARLPCDGGRSRRPAPRQARAAMLWGLGLFVFSQAALGLYIERRRPELRDPTFEIKYRQLKKQVSAAPAPPVTVVFFGSSMTASGIDAGLLEGPVAQAAGRPAVVFNLGVYNSGPLSNLIYLRRLLKRGLRPDLAVIEVSPLLHDFPTAPSDLALFPAQRLEHGEVALVQRYGNDKERWQQWWQSCLVPVYGHRLAILNYCRAQFLVPFNDRLPLWQHMDVHGWIHGWLQQQVNEPKRHREALAWTRRVIGPRLAHYAPGEPPHRALTELLDLVKQEHVPAMLLQMPEGPLLQSLYAPGSEVAIIAEFERLARQYHLPLVRARNWLSEDQMYDSHHATGAGARVLTERLGREAIVPLLRQASRLEQIASK